MKAGASCHGVSVRRRGKAKDEGRTIVGAILQLCVSQKDKPRNK